MKEITIDQEFGSILAAVPHQDDEILMAAGILHRAAVLGLKTRVVMATNGDYGCRDFTKGQKRLKESLAGLKALGLAEEQLIPLGYADTGMEREKSFLYKLYQEKDSRKEYASSCSRETYGRPELPEYHMQAHNTHAAYCRENFWNDLKEVIQKERPDHIFTTSCYDTHGDHEALYYFIRDILREEKAKGYQPRLYTGIVHSTAGDENWPLRQGAAYTCPKGFSEQKELKWEERLVFPLPQEMLAQELKKTALRKHEEALEPNAVDFLMSFLKGEEVFWQIPY